MIVEFVRSGGTVDNDQREICLARARLAAQFPELPPEQIARSVHGTYEDYAQSTIRDFVPMLVERSVRERLPSTPAPHRA